LALAAVAMAAACTSTADAGTIANWKELNPNVAPFTSGLDTNGPTFGDGTNADAQSAWIAGRFGTTASPESVTLAVGEILTVSGNLVLTGGTIPDNGYRFGIYNDGGKFAAGSGNNWTGGWNHQTSTDLFQGRTDGAFVSTMGNAVDLNAVKTSTGSLDKDSTLPLTWTMSITRDSATTVDIVSTFTGGGGSLNQEYTVADQTTSLFTYTAAGLLFGGNTSVDRGVFSNVQYSVIPEPATMSLLALGGLGAVARRRRKA